MQKRPGAILALALALSGCGGGDDDPPQAVSAATLKQPGAAWRDLTPVQKKTVVAYCLPPKSRDVSPTQVAGAINRLYAEAAARGRAGAAGRGPTIGAACNQSLTEIRTAAQSARVETRKRVARTSRALLAVCPENPQLPQPTRLATLTKRLAAAYQRTTDPAKDRRYVERAIDRLESGCGPSAALQQALKGRAGDSSQDAGARGARTLIGSSPREVGDLVVPRSSDLRWTRGGESAYLSMTDEEGRLSFLSEAPRGYRGVPAGTYRDVWVDSDGPWTIVITPRW